MDGDVSIGPLRSLQVSWPSPLSGAHGESRPRRNLGQDAGGCPFYPRCILVDPRLKRLFFQFFTFPGEDRTELEEAKSSVLGTTLFGQATSGQFALG